MPGEEGVIYGYNRHLYGGIEPSTMKSFTVTTLSDVETGNPIGAAINATPPDDTIVDEEVLCSVAGTKIVHNLYHEPVNEFDGEVVMELKPGETLNGFPWSPPNQNGIVPTAFLKAFPYSTNNVYGRNSKNLVIFNPPPAVNSLSVTQTFDSEVQKYNVNLSITVPTVINKVVVGRIPGTQLALVTPEECEKTWVIENDTMVSDGSLKTLSVIDTEVESAQQYTYIVFPSISNDIYNTDSTNRISVTVSDATPPGDLKSFGVFGTDLEGEIKFTLTWPEGECTGVRIVAKEESFPTSLTDGIVIDINYPVTTEQRCEYSPGAKYYIRAFPYINNSGDLIYNTNTTNHQKIVTIKQHTYLFGFDIDIEDPNPSTRVHYPQGVDNYGWNPVKSTLKGAQNLGSWTWINEAGRYFIPTPCVLYPNGGLKQELNPNNYNETTSGAASTIGYSNTESPNYYPNYAVMVRFGKIYTKRWEDTVNDVKKYHFRVSDMAIDSDYDCWCNYNKDGNVASSFYITAYPAYFMKKSPLFTSKYSYNTLRGEYIITPSSDNGYTNYWNLMTLPQYCLLCDLLILMARSTNPHTAFGSDAICDASSYLENSYGMDSGTLDTDGLFCYTEGEASGSSITKPAVIKVFGIESFYTFAPKRLYGFEILRNSTTNMYWFRMKPKIADTTYIDDTSGTGFYNTTYVKYMTTFSWGRMPKNITGEYGTETTYECSYYPRVASKNDIGYTVGIGSLISWNTKKLSPWTMYANTSHIDYDKNMYQILGCYIPAY